MIVLFLQFQAGAKGKEEAGVHLAGKVPLTQRRPAHFVVGSIQMA
jgi:hypothetical protein